MKTPQSPTPMKRTASDMLASTLTPTKTGRADTTTVPPAAPTKKPKTAGDYACTKCSKTYKTTKGLEKHVATLHDDTAAQAAEAETNNARLDQVLGHDYTAATSNQDLRDAILVLQTALRPYRAGEVAKQEAVAAEAKYRSDNVPVFVDKLRGRIATEVSAQGISKEWSAKYKRPDWSTVKSVVIKDVWQGALDGLLQEDKLEAAVKRTKAAITTIPENSIDLSTLADEGIARHFRYSTIPAHLKSFKYTPQKEELVLKIRWGPKE